MMKIKLIAVLLISIFAFSSCKDRKCVKCEYNFDVQKGTDEECYDSNKEARNGMDSWMNNCMELGKRMGGVSKCNCKRVEEL